MKKTKRTLLVLIAMVVLSVCLFGLNGCSDKSTEDVKVFLPDGTPALALANVLNSNADFSKRKTEFNIVTADVISTAFSALDADLAIMPTVVAANLFSKGLKIKMLSANVFGNLFVVGASNTATTLASLKGKVVMVTVGTTLNLFKYLLAQNNIVVAEGAEAVADKVTLNTMADAAAIIQLLKQASNNNTEAYGVLGEPQVTKCKQLVSNATIVVDFQAEWKTITQFDGYPQAGLFATEQFVNDNPVYVKAILNALKDNAEFLTQNFASLPSLFERYESNLQKMTFDATTITNCNIRLTLAKDAKDSVNDYIGRILPTATLTDEFFA